MSGSGVRTVARIVLAAAGGYLASSSVMAIFCLLLAMSGMPRADAVTLGIILVFVFYLCLVLWVFAERTLWRPFAALLALGIFGYALAFFLGHGGGA